MLLYCSRCLFALWQNSVDSLKLPSLSSCPATCTGGLKGSVMHTLGIPMKDQAPQALGASAQLSPLIEICPCRDGEYWGNSLSLGKIKVPRLQRPTPRTTRRHLYTWEKPVQDLVWRLGTWGISSTPYVHAGTHAGSCADLCLMWRHQSAQVLARR